MEILKKATDEWGKNEDDELYIPVVHWEYGFQSWNRLE